MKIICDSKEEYDRLNRTFKYLHDFSVVPEDFDEDDVGICLDQDYEMVGLLCHLYSEGKDFPNKENFMIIKEK